MVNRFAYVPYRSNLLAMLTKDDENGFTLSPEEEAELLLSIAEADRGETISAEELLAKLARRIPD
ncbi:MAG: hypothetical protein A3G41_05980 [Elusimicrobia bacterium RIFCSPLOWO2_12_FULL_59_9]|nr:MAG: hypothetical protein A3G41_05980 [Elusimicrobia bacterium RIFCSPLOWO2_12_FULL_59_9]